MISEMKGNASKQLRGDDYARKLLETIREVRAEHHACTLRELSRRLGGVNHNVINRQFDVLARAGLVEATSMPGSIHLTAKGSKVASGSPMPQLQTRSGLPRARVIADAPAESPWPPPPPPAG